MSYDVTALTPKPVWRYFDKIRQIPRASGNERRLAEAILEWAAETGAKGELDSVGNAVVRVPATAGLDKTPTIVLQSHMDMVCEKGSDVVFDFDTDAINLVREGEWITANGTTLGADNGIGLACALAFLDPEVGIHGPLEILCTVEEETGLTGAAALETTFITGRMLFNLDSEEDGIFYVGCAGGMDKLATLPIERKAVDASAHAFEIRVSGLRGGHSGLDIIHNRGNAAILLARVLKDLSSKLAFNLAELRAGDKHNAIPREAIVIITTSDADASSRLLAVLEGSKRAILDEFGAEEPDVDVVSAPARLPSSIMSTAETERLLDLIIAMPNGIASMIRDIPGVVETSNNLARIRTDGREVAILLSARSSVASALLAESDKIDAVCRLAGARTKTLSSYPGWKPNMASKMLARAKTVWQSLHGASPEIHVVHAGLECGLIGEKLEGIDMISLGPTIEMPHSPSERVHIPSVARFFDFMKAFLAAIANDR